MSVHELIMMSFIDQFVALVWDCKFVGFDVDEVLKGGSLYEIRKPGSGIKNGERKATVTFEFGTSLDFLAPAFV